MANYVPNAGYKNFLNKYGITSQAGYIVANGWGYGQVEPNHLAGQATKETFAQLPAKKDITILENGQFAKYDYANNQVNFTGKGEWLLVWNEIKLYREEQTDAEFALIADNFKARVYSPFGGNGVDEDWTKQSRYYNGVDDQGNSSITLGSKTYNFDDVTGPDDIYEKHSTQDPFHIVTEYKEKMMSDLGDVNSMVPRLMKTFVGDIYTTNMVKDATLAVGDELYVGDKGILTKTKKEAADTNGDASGDMIWQVVKVYTMPDHQPGVKLMRIQ